MCWKQMLTQAMQCEQKLLKASMDMVAWILSASKCQFWCCLWWLHQRSISVTGLHWTWYRQITLIGTTWPRSWFESWTYLGLGLSQIGLNQSHWGTTCRWSWSWVQSDFAKVMSGLGGLGGSAAAETGAKVAPALLLSTLLCLALLHLALLCPAMVSKSPPKPPPLAGCSTIIATKTITSR